MRRFARTFATLLRRHRCSQRAIAIRTGWVLQAALLAATTLCAGSAARAAGFDQFIGFGDSTMDSGYFRYGQTGGLFQLGGASARAVDAGIKSAVAAGVSGAFVGPGVMNTSSLAARFGLTAVPVTFPAGARTNHGNGSAQTVSTTQGDGYLNGFLNNVPTVAQISNYLGAGHAAANTNALYMISTGANDLFWMQTQRASLSPAQIDQAYMKPFAATLATSVAALQADGARTIVVVNPTNTRGWSMRTGASALPAPSTLPSRGPTERRSGRP